MCAQRSYDLTASCKAFPSYQGRAAETASSIAGFLIERLEVLLCSLHETQHFREVTQGALITPGVELAARGEDKQGNSPSKELDQAPPLQFSAPQAWGCWAAQNPQNQSSFLLFHPPCARARWGSAVGPAHNREHRLKQPRLSPGLMPPGRLFKEAAAAVPAQRWQGFHLGTVERTPWQSISGILIAHLELLFGPSHFIHLTYL